MKLHAFVSAKADTSDATKVGSARWNAGHVETLSPQYYGAVADGATNDSTAIQAALTAGDVVFPAGSYAFKNVTIPSDRQIVFEPGAVCVPVAGCATTDEFFNAIGTSGAHLSNISIQNLRVEGSASMGRAVNCDYVDGLDIVGGSISTLGHSAIYLSNTTKFLVSGLRIETLSGAVSGIEALAGCAKGRISDNHFYSMGLDAILIYGATGNITVADNYCEKFDTNASTGRGGIHAYDTQRITIVGNTIVGTGSGATSGIRLRNASSFTVTGNHIYDAQRAAIEVVCISDPADTYNAGRGTISDNTVEACRRGIVYSYDVAESETQGGTHPVTISANCIYGLVDPATGTTGADGIAVNADYCTVQGNVVQDVPGCGIIAYGNGMSVMGNTVIDAGGGATGGTDAGFEIAGTNIRLIGNTVVETRDPATMNDAYQIAADSTGVAKDNVVVGTPLSDAVQNAGIGFIFEVSDTVPPSDVGSAWVGSKFSVGDRCWNTDPDATNELGWYCTVGDGSDVGTWVAMSTDT